MKSRSIKGKKDESAINQLGDPNSVTVPPVPTPTPVNVPASTTTAGGYDVPASTTTAGGTVSTSGTAVSSKKSILKDAEKALAKSDNDNGEQMINPKAQADILRRQAEQLRAAASTCRYNISNLGWTYCRVTVDFEGNREISIQEAEAYATELEKRALALEQSHGGQLIKAASLHLNESYSMHDCSHFLYQVFHECGLDYPYTPTANFPPPNFFRLVSSPQEGDVVLLKGHMGIYSKDNKIISAQSGAGKVLETPIPYFQLNIKGYYRWYQDR